MKKKIVLFVPLTITIAVLDMVAVTMAVYEQNLALGIAVLLMLIASAVAFYKIFTVNRSMNRFYKKISTLS